MNNFMHARVLFFCCLLLTALLAMAFGESKVNTANQPVPKNATARTYGGGWECNRGFQEADGTCIAIRVPANAYASGSSYGRGWECGRGYEEVDKRCVAVTIPPNAFLSSFGDKWECNRGYR